MRGMMKPVCILLFCISFYLYSILVFSVAAPQEGMRGAFSPQIFYCPPVCPSPTMTNVLKLDQI